MTLISSTLKNNILYTVVTRTYLSQTDSASAS